LWVCDGPWGLDKCGSGVAFIGPVPAVYIGALLMLIVTAIVVFVVARHPDRLTILLGLTVLALAFYVVPTRVHERYAYPFFALAILLAAFAWRWRVAYLVLSVTVFVNMYAALTLPFYDNPGISDWLGIGPTARSWSGVAVVATVNGLAFLWVLAQLRSSARARLADELEDEIWLASSEDEPPEPDSPPAPYDRRAIGGAAAGSSAGAAAAATAGEGWMRLPPDRGVEPPPRPSSGGAAAPAAGAVAVAMPTWTPRPTFAELGIVGWFRARAGEPPVRPDRSASLARERGGRLDRLDLWFLVVLVVASMALRTFRLAEPYQMHFDEVYHARTATEFLQDWRYGISHNIYEYTHPHLAKYIMAAGIVLWGEDDVASTSELGVPVVASVVEPRRVDPSAPGQRAGERLHVATGTEIRTYDLTTRQLVSVVPAQGSSALAIDPTGSQLVVGFDDGRLATLDLDSSGVGGVDGGVEPVALGSVDHPISRLLVTDDGSAVVAASTDRLTFVDMADGSSNGTLDLPGIAGLAPGGTGQALVADIDQVEDVPSAAAKLADILSVDAADLESKLKAASPGETVVLGSPGTGADRTALDKAIADGVLPGVRVDDVTRIAVADANGVTFVDPATVSLVTTVAMIGGAHGLAPVTGIDDTKLYVTSGSADEPTYEEVAIAGDAAKNGPVSLNKNPLPGLGTWVAYDAASQQVHILGHATDGVGWTVYVIEPHGRAVYADARLPDGFVPSAWASDIEPDYPSTDRQQLLLFDGDGASASINLGSHAFAWRLPGVIAGVITAALLYLLARILFRRRLVAVLVGLSSGRRDVLRPVPDRHERHLRRVLHRRRVHAVRRDLDRLVARPGGRLVRHARRRAAARTGPCEQVGGGLRDRCPGPAHPHPQRPGPGAGDPRPDRAHVRPGLHGDQRPGGIGAGQPDLPVDHDRAHPAGRRGRGDAPDRLDGRGAPVRGRRAGGCRVGRLLRDAGDRQDPDGLHLRAAELHAAAGGDRPRPGLAGRRRAVLGGRTDRLRSARRAARAGRPGGPPAAARPGA
jgi:hypothetical protein